MHIEASYCNSCLVRLIRHPTVKPTLKVRSWLHTKQNLSGRSLSCENRTAFHVENRPSPPKQLCNLTFTLLQESALRTTSATGSGVEIRELSKSCETSEMRLKTGGNFPLAKLTIAGRIEDTTMNLDEYIKNALNDVMNGCTEAGHSVPSEITFAIRLDSQGNASPNESLAVATVTFTIPVI